VGLANMSNPKYLDLTVSQVQGNMSLTTMSNPKYLDLAVSQVQSDDHHPLVHPRELSSSLGRPKGMR